MFKANNEDTKTTPAVVLVSLLLTMRITPCSSVSIAKFASWNSYFHCLNVVLRIVHLHQLTCLRLLHQVSLQILLIYHSIDP